MPDASLLRDRHVPIYIPALQSRPRLPHAMLGITSVYLLYMNICRKLVMKVVAGLSDLAAKDRLVRYWRYLQGLHSPMVILRLEDGMLVSCFEVFLAGQ